MLSSLSNPSGVAVVLPAGSHDSDWSGSWTAAVGETSRLVTLFLSFLLD